MPYFEECLHCGTVTRLSTSTAEKMHLVKSDDKRFTQSCLACGIANAPHVRYWLGVDPIRVVEVEI